MVKKRHRYRMRASKEIYDKYGDGNEEGQAAILWANVQDEPIYNK